MTDAPKVPRSLLKRMERHKNEISKRRDALRDVMDDLEAIIGSADRGVEALDEAIAAFSEHL
jgi:exonuclease VII small subunit